MDAAIAIAAMRVLEDAHEQDPDAVGTYTLHEDYSARGDRAPVHAISGPDPVLIGYALGVSVPLEHYSTGQMPAVSTDSLGRGVIVY